MPVKHEESKKGSMESYMKPVLKNSNTESSQKSIKTEKVEIKTETADHTESLLWVDKYKPSNMAKIIGQQGDKSNAKKLQHWLKNWHKFHDPSQKSKESGAGKSWNRDDGLNFKAALLSGPPGIGKTTTATLVCQEAGFTFIELNASDSRSKKLLDQILGGSTNNLSIEHYFGTQSQSSQSQKSQSTSSEKHCIIMDEVDGMAGNEDRGGVQELINAIKQSKVPIICICNDRQHIKIRSLANYCFDLRFSRPRVEQIRAALMSICFKEGIKITPDLLDQIVIGANHDIRQCIHNLSMWSSNNKEMNTQKTQADIEKSIKDTKINPFEACRQVFYNDPQKPKSIIDKMDYFFCDYSLVPLLVHENYLLVNSSKYKSKNSTQYLTALTDSIESICAGDRISKQIRTGNNWSLLPTQAIFSSVIPGTKMEGTMGMAQFSSWFGKNSKQGRVDRILQELQKHLRLKTSANKFAVGMEYLSMFKERLTKPLISKGSDGVQTVLHTMNEYYLTREDFDTIVELSTWPGQVDLMTKIDSKVKAAFTRAYNKESHMNPFAVVDFKKLKKKAGDEDFEMGGEDGGDGERTAVSDDDEEDDGVDNDTMVKKVTKPAGKAKATTSKAAAGAGAKATATKSAATKRAAEPTTKASASKKKKV